MNWKKFLILVTVGGFLYLTIQIFESETLIKKGDVVVSISDVKNIDKFYQFIEDVKNKKKSQVRIVAFTKEGDPIIEELKFDGKIIRYTHDDSRDTFGGRDKGNATSIYDEIIVKEKTVYEKVYQEYFLKKEGKKNRMILQLQKN